MSQLIIPNYSSPVCLAITKHHFRKLAIFGTSQDQPLPHILSGHQFCFPVTSSTPRLSALLLTPAAITVLLVSTATKYQLFLQVALHPTSHQKIAMSIQQFFLLVWSFHPKVLMVLCSQPLLSIPMESEVQHWGKSQIRSDGL